MRAKKAHVKNARCQGQLERLSSAGGKRSPDVLGDRFGKYAVACLSEVERVPFRQSIIERYRAEIVCEDALLAAYRDRDSVELAVDCGGSCVIFRIEAVLICQGPPVSV